MVRGTDNGRQKTEIMVMTSLWAESYLLNYHDHPRKLVTLSPKLKSTGAGLSDFFPVGGMPTASSLAKTSLEKSGRCGIAAD